MLRRLFFEGGDVGKSEVFKRNAILWAPIRDKAEVWVKEGWARWEEEKPEWFTDRWKAKVPGSMKPSRTAGGIDDSSEMSADFEKEDNLRVVGGQNQVNQRSSFKEMLRAKSITKISPEGVENVVDFDEEDFLRELSQRESIHDR